MNPDLAARLLGQELEDTLADTSDAPAAAVVLMIVAPTDLGPDARFQVRASLGSRAVEADLPASLAIGYLADEEAAVDEWKCWVAELGRRLGIGLLKSR